MYLHDRDINFASFYGLLLDFRTDRTVWYIFVLYFIQKLVCQVEQDEKKMFSRSPL